MKHFLSILGVVAATILLFVSAAMNWRYGFTLGKTELDAHIYGAASAAADGLKALVPFFILWALRQRNYGQMLAGTLLLLVCTAYSLTSSLGFAALNRSDTTGARANQAQLYQDMRGELSRAEEKLSWVPQHRSIGEVEADLSALLSKPVVVGRGRRAKTIGTVEEVTTGCSSPHYRAQKTCNKILNLRKELAVANQASKLERRIGELKEKIAAFSATTAPGVVTSVADPQATLLSKITGLESAQVQMALVILVSLLVELGSSLGLFVAISHMSGHDRPKMEVFEPHTMKVVKPKPKKRLLLSRSDIERYYASNVEISEGASVTSTDLYQDYCAWCEKHSRQPMALTVFGRQLSEQGVQKARIGGRNRYIGITLKNAASITDESEDQIEGTVAIAQSR